MNAKIFYTDFRNMQHVYFQLMFKNRTSEEDIEFKKARRENFKLSVFVIFLLTPFPFFSVIYFILVPKFFWPETLKKVLNIKKESSDS